MWTDLWNNQLVHTTIDPVRPDSFPQFDFLFTEDCTWWGSLWGVHVVISPSEKLRKAETWYSLYGLVLDYNTVSPITRLFRKLRTCALSKIHLTKIQCGCSTSSCCIHHFIPEPRMAFYLRNKTLCWGLCWLAQGWPISPRAVGPRPFGHPRESPENINSLSICLDGLGVLLSLHTVWRSRSSRQKI